MRVGFLLDDLICDTSVFFSEMGINMFDYPFSNQMLNIIPSEASVIAKIKPISGGLETLSFLKKRGYIINVFSDRPKHLFKITSAWLKKYNVCFDSLIFSKECARLAVDFKIDMMVATNFNLLLDFTIYDRMIFKKLILFTKKYNEKRNHPRFLRANSWNEVKKFLTRRGGSYYNERN